MAWLSREQINSMGFLFVGKEVLLSDKASFYGCERISIGDKSRIDDFCVLSAGEGGIDIGRYVHIAVFCSIIGAEKIKIADFANCSSRVSIYSSNDDYSGLFMTNPTVPPEFTGVVSLPVNIEKHVIIGSGSVILPGVIIGLGVSIGALSLVRKDCIDFGVYAGYPAKKIADRARNFLELEQLMMQKSTVDIHDFMS